MRRCLALLAALGFAGVAVAKDLTDVDAAYARVADSQLGAYRAVLAEYDRAGRAKPGDVGLAVARCEFIDRFFHLVDLEWASTATADRDACHADLQRRFGAAPHAQVYLYSTQWDDDVAERGDALLVQAQRWPRDERCRLLDAVTENHELAEDYVRAGELAVEGVRLCGADRITRAVSHLLDKGLAEPAATMLAAAPVTDDAAEAGERVRIALRHPDRVLARREFERHRDAGVDVDKTLQARALFRAGDVAAAAQVLPKEDANVASGAVASLRFDLALALGDVRAAAARVSLADVATDTGRARLLKRYARVVAAQPLLALQMPLLPVTGALLLVGAALLLLPGLLLVPAHYRGLIRRQRGQVPAPLFASVGLTKAWIALAAALLVPSLVAFVIANGAETPGQGSFTLRTLFWSSAIQVVLFAPWAVRIGRDGWFGTVGARQVAGLVLRAWLVVIATSLLVGMLLLHAGSGSLETAHTRTVDAMIGDSMGVVGFAGTLLLVAVLAPLCEEFVFRVMLLGGLSRHLGFGASNLLQAAAFAAVHADPPRFAFYLTLGLFCGWLVRRTGGVLPALVLHALNNAVFLLLMLAA